MVISIKSHFNGYDIIKSLFIIIIIIFIIITIFLLVIVKIIAIL